VEPFDLAFAVQATGGRLQGAPPATPVLAVETDSRKVKPGMLFVALAGERFDGHRFVDDALRNGAVAVVVDEDRAASGAGGATIVVTQTRAALGRLAAAHRRRFSPVVVAVAGSNGKTTTKELLAGVLGQRWPTLSSPASFNNDVGVPLTLLGLERSHGAAVVEVGTNHPGELAPLVRMADPGYGVVTNLGREHLEHFVDLEGVAEEEGWLAELLPADGRLFVSDDHPLMDRVIRRCQAPVVRVGRSLGADWRVTAVEPDQEGLDFEVAATDESVCGRYRVNLIGRHQVTNALLALAVGRALGLEAAELRTGLASVQPPRHRMEIWKVGEIRVLDDVYNANADSMLAALESLRDFPCTGRRIAVLGEMAETGHRSSELHAEVGRAVATNGIDQLFVVGSMAGAMGAAARQAGLGRVMEFADVDGAVYAVTRFVRPGDVVLVKASRAARLERVSEALRLGSERPPLAAA
jgi:UDP-N-acetylmuramoyl-tripeptide--D-alanyl-D-alanine ligase